MADTKEIRYAIMNGISFGSAKKENDDKYLKELFENTRKLYHLDQIQVSGAEENSRDLGPFPATAVGLLALLGAAWVLILLYLIVDRIRSGKK